MRIGFIGAGKMGFSLGKFLAEKNAVILGYTSRRKASADKAAAFVGTGVFENIYELVRKCDCIFVTVPDDAIGEVWKSLAQTEISGKLFCHCSGSINSDIFKDARIRGASACSLHPLMPLADIYHSYKLLANAVFAIEGYNPGRDIIHTFIEKIGNRVYLLDKDKKALYHCAAVFVSNFSTALAHIGEKMFKDCGMELATDALFQLMLENVHAVKNYGVIHALTGPIERGDIKTLSQHLECLPNTDKKLYALLGKKLLEIAATKHPGRDYSPVKEKLTEQGT